MRDDFLLDDTNDLIDLGEEWSEGESSEDDVDLIVIAEKGVNREFPFSGFGIQSRLKARVDSTRFIRDLKVELENDGFINPVITIGENFTDFKIEIE